MAREAAEGYWGLEARRCDSCKGSPAVLFCRADAASLCGTCDSSMHGANRLASRHERVWMCEVCERGPAAVTCKADAATLCVTCDADIHEANPLARRHERFPVVPFYEPLSSAIRPSAAAAASSSGDEDDHESSDAIAAARWMMPNPGTGTNPKAMMEVPDLNFADVDPYLDLDYADGLVSMQGKPVAPPATMIAPNGVVKIDIALGKSSYSSCNAAHSLSHSVSLSEVGVIPDSGGGAMAGVSNPYGRPAAAANPAAAMNREARVMRYREKRKNRKFEKKIWYASRKASAATRPRIKGRFAKRVEMDADVDRIYSAAPVAGFLADNGYGVVPSL